MPLGVRFHLLVWPTLGVACFLAAGYFAYYGEPVLAAKAALASAAALLIHFNYRCPKCRTHLNETIQGYHGVGAVSPPDCVVCHRPKKGTWPFQWLIRPERSGLR